MLGWLRAIIQPPSVIQPTGETGMGPICELGPISVRFWILSYVPLRNQVWLWFQDVNCNLGAIILASWIMTVPGWKSYQMRAPCTHPKRMEFTFCISTSDFFFFSTFEETRAHAPTFAHSSPFLAEQGLGDLHKWISLLAEKFYLVRTVTR